MEDIITNIIKLSYESEYNYWINNIIEKWKDLPTTCPNCDKQSLKMNKIKKSISNPIKLKCNKVGCRKIANIKDNTLFSFLPKIPISVNVKIIELFLLDNKNSLEIINDLKEYYNINTINRQIAYKTIGLVPKSISHYLKEIYMKKWQMIISKII